MKWSLIKCALEHVTPKQSICSIILDRSWSSDSLLLKTIIITNSIMVTLHALHIIMFALPLLLLYQ